MISWCKDGCKFSCQGIIAFLLTIPGLLLEILGFDMADLADTMTGEASEASARKLDDLEESQQAAKEEPQKGRVAFRRNPQILVAQVTLEEPPGEDALVLGPLETQLQESQSADLPQMSFSLIPRLLPGELLCWPSKKPSLRV